MEILSLKNAVVRFGEVIQEALAKNGFTPDKIDCLIPHQANSVDCTIYSKANGAA